MALTDLRAKLHEEKLRETATAREVLARQHEVELARAIKIRDAEVQRLQGLVNALRDGAADKLKNALLAEAREEARRAFDGERIKLQQEVGLFMYVCIHEGSKATEWAHSSCISSFSLHIVSSQEKRTICEDFIPPINTMMIKIYFVGKSASVTEFVSTFL